MATITQSQNGEVFGLSSQTTSYDVFRLGCPTCSLDDYAVKKTFERTKTYAESTVYRNRAERR